MSLDVYLTGRGGGFSANITHNMGPMASACGLYEPCWHPELISATRAYHLIGPLTEGLIQLVLRRSELLALEPANKRGSWEAFVGFVAEYRDACIASPLAKVRVCI